MRKRTRRRRHRQRINLNKLAFLSLVLSIVTACGFFSVPRMLLNRIQNYSRTEQAAKTEETTEQRTETEKYYNNLPSVSHKFSSKYDDITKLENDAKSNLDSVENDGKISSEDYSSKNITATFGCVNLRNTTKDVKVNIQDYLNKEIVANVEKDKPVVLVYHTHISESYQISENEFYSKYLFANEENFGVLRAGDALCDTIESYGYKVIHDKTVYDTSFSGAFDRSRDNISKILRENPSIQIVIDLHRDSITRKDGTKVKTVTEIDGKKVAQIQITAGCENGIVTGFPNWEKNLTFAIHLQNALALSYPKVARPIFFCARKYNLDLVPCAVNVDIGTEANTVREAVYSAELLGEAVVKVLKECEKL